MRQTLDMSDKSLILTPELLSSPGLNGPTVLGHPDWTRFSPRGRTTQQVRFMLECRHSWRPDGHRRTPLYASISFGGDG